MKRRFHKMKNENPRTENEDPQNENPHKAFFAAASVLRGVVFLKAKAHTQCVLRRRLYAAWRVRCH